MKPFNATVTLATPGVQDAPPTRLPLARSVGIDRVQVVEVAAALREYTERPVSHIR